MFGQSGARKKVFPLSSLLCTSVRNTKSLPKVEYVTLPVDCRMHQLLLFGSKVNKVLTTLFPGVWSVFPRTQSPCIVNVMYYSLWRLQAANVSNPTDSHTGTIVHLLIEILRIVPHNPFPLLTARGVIESWRILFIMTELNCREFYFITAIVQLDDTKHQVSFIHFYW